MKLIKNEHGQNAINRIIPVYGGLMLSVGFVKEAWSRSLTWLDYVGFALGLVVLYAPNAAVKLINAMRGTVEAPAVSTAGRQAPQGGVD